MKYLILLLVKGYFLNTKSLKEAYYIDSKKVKWDKRELNILTINQLLLIQIKQLNTLFD